MIFTKLTLNNFKSYGHEVIKFGDGITVIVGEMVLENLLF